VLYCSASVFVRPWTGERIPQRMMRHYFGGVLRDLGIGIQAQGVEKIRTAGPCILVVNHNSLLDVPCVGVLLDIDYKWVAKREIFRIPFVGWHLRACGHFWIDRSQHRNSQRLEEQFHRVLQSGASILMFPEGTRSVDGRLQAFRKGAFATAVHENVPVLPIAVCGTEAILRKGSLDVLRGQRTVVGVRVGDPIAPPPLEWGELDRRICAMRDQARAAIAVALDELRGEAGASDRPTPALPS